MASSSWKDKDYKLLVFYDEEAPKGGGGAQSEFVKALAERKFKVEPEDFHPTHSSFFGGSRNHDGKPPYVYGVKLKTGIVMSLLRHRDVDSVDGLPFRVIRQSRSAVAANR